MYILPSGLADPPADNLDDVIPVGFGPSVDPFRNGPANYQPEPRPNGLDERFQSLERHLNHESERIRKHLAQRLNQLEETLDEEIAQRRIQLNQLILTLADAVDRVQTQTRGDFSGQHQQTEKALHELIHSLSVTRGELKNLSAELRDGEEEDSQDAA